MKGRRSGAGRDWWRKQHPPVLPYPEGITERDEELLLELVNSVYHGVGPDLGEIHCEDFVDMFSGQVHGTCWRGYYNGTDEEKEAVQRMVGIFLDYQNPAYGWTHKVVLEEATRYADKEGMIRT